MDPKTLDAYERAAAGFAQEWHEQPPPSDLHAVVRRFFVAGQCADIGCGSGREVAWLSANGYPAVGYDASDALLAQARLRYPQHSFHVAALPELAGISDATFDNVLCETVIMHLARDRIAPAVRRLMSIVRPGGMLYLSWRVTVGDDGRDAHGRLYSAFGSALVRDALAGSTIALDEEVVSASSGKTIHRMVAERRHTYATGGRP
jgi:2-polyprenyl-3-methyl-5-hydroxy-6-metoxy-1,4-benzoquinol methylase